MKTLGIISALQSEIGCLTDTKVTPMQIYPLADNLCAILSGMGERNVRRASELLLNKNIEGLISFGTCAALSENIKAGELILADCVLTENDERLASSESWRAAVMKYLNDHSISVHQGDNYSSSSVITSAADKTALARRTGAIAVDMESAFVFKIAQNNKLPALSLKVVVDESHLSIPSAILESTDEYGQANIPGLLMSVIRQPGLCADLMRLGGGFSQARKTMLWVGRHAEQMFSKL